MLSQLTLMVGCLVGGAPSGQQMQGLVHIHTAVEVMSTGTWPHN